MALITAAQVISVLGWETDMEEAKIDPWISTAELLHIRPFLGDTFYSTLETEIGAASLSAANQIVWDTWIEKMCAFSVAYTCLPHIAVSVSTQGVQLLNAGEFSASASVKAVSVNQENYKSMIGVMKVQVDAYMTDSDNSDDFEDYIDNKAEEGVDPGGVYFGLIRPEKRNIN